VRMTIVILVALGLLIPVRIVTLAFAASLILGLALGGLTPPLLALLPRAGDRRRGFNRQDVGRVRNDRMNRIHGERNVVIRRLCDSRH
jgi:hypothetical protein